MNVAFDFDMTLMFPVNIINRDDPEIGSPNIEFVNKCKNHIKNKDTVFIITSRKFSDLSIKQINKFLSHNNINISNTNIFHTDGKMSKAEYSIKNNLDISILYDDDGLELVEAKKLNIIPINSFNNDAKNAFNKFYEIEESKKKINNFKTFFNTTKV